MTKLSISDLQGFQRSSQTIFCAYAIPYRGMLLRYVIYALYVQAFESYDSRRLPAFILSE